MKKFLGLVLCAVLAAGLCSCGKEEVNNTEKTPDNGQSVSEKAESGNNGRVCDDVSLFDYEEIDNGITIIHFRNHNYEEYDKIIVPSEIDGKKVIGIGLKDEDSNAMTGVCGNCEVVLPETVEFIGRYAFDGARGLVKLSGAENCREILDFAFSNCENLKEVTFIDSVETVSDSAFIGCTAWEQAHS